MDIILDDIKYKLDNKGKDNFDEEQFKELYTDYFKDFDYIVGDWAYNKLRLKGFYKKNNKKSKEINNIKNLDKYLKEQCAYGCKYFILEKTK